MFVRQTSQQEPKPTKANVPWKRALMLVASGIALVGCAPNHLVDKPCGVLADSLKTVQATTPDGEKRLSIHYERGISAGCWDRKAEA